MSSDKPIGLGSPPRVVITGGGPAGASLAIRLAKLGARVTIVERAEFPREKLCGEFVTPECLSHFADLGVANAIQQKVPPPISRTQFYSPKGRSVSIPSTFFGTGGEAIGISRAALDLALLECARDLGAEVHEGSRVIGLDTVAGKAVGISIRLKNGDTMKVSGDIFVDASGRSAALTSLADRSADKERTLKSRPAYVGFKTHLDGVEIAPAACEIYIFDGGYGGIARVEGGRANLCCLVRAERASEFIGSTNNVLRVLSTRNSRALETLENARLLYPPITVAVGRFGENHGSSLANVFAVGDAGAFIDPFTGSGILMALESSRYLAEALSAGAFEPAAAHPIYLRRRTDAFRTRLRVSAALRWFSGSTAAASAAIRVAGASSTIAAALARATRGNRRNAAAASNRILLD